MPLSPHGLTTPSQLEMYCTATLDPTNTQVKLLKSEDLNTDILFLEFAILFFSFDSSTQAFSEASLVVSLDSEFFVWGHVFLHPPHDHDHDHDVKVDAGGEFFRAKLELHCRIEWDPELAQAQLESMISSSNK